MMHAVRAYTGPVWVRQYAEKCREAGLTVKLVGTEHVYVESEGQTPEHAAWNAGVIMRQRFGSDFALDFVCDP